MSMLWAAAALAASARGASDFATTVLAWSGTGGVASYNTDPTVALGPPSPLATPTVPDNSSVFSFGWGGYLTLGFDRPITDDPRHPGGLDFIVFGNSLYNSGDTATAFREPGYVEVGVDTTGRHQYGDGSRVAWYWLKGSPAPVTVAGFPIALPASGTPVWGYADCTPTDGTGNPLLPSDAMAGRITQGSAGGDAFDLAWAVDASGAPAHLAAADFVRISCAVNAVVLPVGRISTEVDAVSLVAPRTLKGDVDGDARVTLADAALCLRAATGRASLSPDQLQAALMTDHPAPPTPDDAARIVRLAAGL